MILVELPPATPLFRAHTPRWASQPLSGAGAALRGGRFNREGIAALYLSLDELTALREYQQTSAFLPPATLCTYSANLPALVDLRLLQKDAAWDELWHDWREDWRHLRFEQHIEPPTWVLADLVRAQWRGVLVVRRLRPGVTRCLESAGRERLDIGRSRRKMDRPAIPRTTSQALWLSQLAPAHS